MDRQDEILSEIERICAGLDTIQAGLKEMLQVFAAIDARLAASAGALQQPQAATPQPPGTP